MKYRVFYTESAKQDLKDIFRYISCDLVEPEIAAKLTQRIMKEIRFLDEMPLRYRLYDEEPWRSRGLRSFPVSNYLVFYIADERAVTVKVVRIMYGGRDIRRQLSEMQFE